MFFCGGKKYLAYRWGGKKLLLFFILIFDEEFLVLALELVTELRQLLPLLLEDGHPCLLTLQLDDDLSDHLFLLEFVITEGRYFLEQRQFFLLELFDDFSVLPKVS